MNNRFKKSLLPVFISGALAVMAGGANAATLTTTSTLFPGSYAGFQSIDWADSGTAYVTGFDIPTLIPGCPAGDCTGLTDSINLEYWARASQLGATGPMTLPNIAVTAGAPGSGIRLTGHEYTIVANFTELAVCANATCSQINFVMVGGGYDIYYDNAPDADPLLGTGFTNGALLLQGTVNPGPSGSFLAIGGPAPGGGGTGSQTLAGAVTYTNPLYIAPDLETTIAGTEIKFGSQFVTTGWALPSGAPSGALRCQTATEICFQADGNQSFGVPEPTSMALLGLGLLGLGAIRRRRK